MKPLRVFRKSWKDIKKQKAFLDVLSLDLGLRTLDDWYRVSNHMVRIRGGSTLLSAYYRDSLADALRSVYPHHSWCPWRFSHVPRNTWKHTWSQRLFFDELSLKLSIRSPEDWYLAKVQDLESSGASGILQRYRHSLLMTLRVLYPEISWQAWRFARVSNGHWEHLEHQRQCLEWSAERFFNVQCPEDWYRVRMQDLKLIRGASEVLRHYRGSITNTLQSVYGEYPWKLWQFSRVPRHFWQDQKTCRSYVHLVLSEEFGISTRTDWELVTTAQLRTLKGSRKMLADSGSLMNVISSLRSTNNDHDDFENTSTHWEMNNANAFRTADMKPRNQMQLCRLIKQLFPGIPIFEEFKDSRLHYETSNERMQIDIAIPSLSLFFEYQGMQHFHWNFKCGSPQKRQFQDRCKRKACEAMGFTLIEIPYWEGIIRSNLIAIIRHHRPDLLSDLSMGSYVQLQEMETTTTRITSSFADFSLMKRPTKSIRIPHGFLHSPVHCFDAFPRQALLSSNCRFIWNSVSLLKKCIPCESGLASLDEQHIQKLLNDLDQQWTLTDDKKKIRRKWKMKDFKSAMCFVQKVGDIAEEKGHHPNLHLENYNHVTIELWTYSLGIYFIFYWYLPMFPNRIF